jgi:hypothetical protein
VLLRVRETPGHPIALVASVLLALGVLMMWRRLIVLAPASGGASARNVTGV